MHANSPQTCLICGEHSINGGVGSGSVQRHDSYLFVSLLKEIASAFVLTSTEKVRHTDQRVHNRCSSLEEAQEASMVSDVRRCRAHLQMSVPSPLPSS